MVNKTDRVIILGFGVVSREGDKHVTRVPIAEYLASWSRYARITWVTHKGDHDAGQHKGYISDQVKVVTLGDNKIENLRRFNGLISEERPFGILAAYPGFLGLFPSLLSYSGRLGVYIGNDFISRPFETQKIVSKFKWFLRKMIALSVVKRADVVFGRGVHLTHELKRFSDNVIETVAITSANSSISSGARNSKHYLYVGKLMREKGVAELLEAYTASLKRNPDMLNLCIVGDGPLSDYVTQVAQLCPKIHVYGYLDDSARLTELYSDAACLIMPTRATWEGVPRVITEAVALGVPVYATPLTTIVAEFGDSIAYFQSMPPTVSSIVYALDNVPSPPCPGVRPKKIGAKFAAEQHREALNAG